LSYFDDPCESDEMQLDVESLRTFATVVDQGGMTAAAEELDLSQSAVSWKIKRLEERVGRSLLIREGRRLRLSRDGRELLRYARTMVDTHDQAVLRMSSSELSGTVKLGATEEVCAACMGGVLSRFNRIHPGASIEFYVDRSQLLDSMLKRGDLDVAVIQVTQNDCLPSDTVLWADDPVWVSARDWTYDEGVVPLITFGEGGLYRPMAEQILSDAGIPYRIAFSGPSSASVLSAVEAGLGVAVISGRSVVGDIIAWPRGEPLPELPEVYQIARAAAGEPSMVAAELIGDIESEMGES
jgi:DNA-binding transcriptional LysR family regulator